MVLEGLDNSDRKEFEVKDITKNLCEVIKVKENKTTSSKKENTKEYVYLETNYSNPSYLDNLISGQTIYQGSSTEASSLGVYFFSFTLVLLLVYFIINRKF